MKFLPCLLFFIGLTRFMDFDLFGRVVVSELLMLLALPVLLLKGGGIFRFRPYWIIIGLIAFASLAIVYGDQKVNGIGLLFSVKGLARLGFLALIITFWFIVLSGGIDRIKYFLWGSVPGAFLAIFRVSEFDREGVQSGGTGYDFWLSKLGPLLLALICALSFHLFQRAKIGAIGLFVFGAIVSAVFAARSIAAFYLITSGAIFVVWWYSLRGASVPRLKFRDYVLYGCLTSAMAGAVYLAYIILAPSGALGEFQQQKFLQQANTSFGVTPWGLVLGGRVDFVQCLLAIQDAPMWGLGSWNLPHSYLFLAYETLGLNTPLYIEALGEGLTTPGHSVMFGMWATNGVFTIPLWLYVAFLTVRLSVRSLYLNSGAMPFLFHSALVVLFTLLFNPLSLGARNSIGLVVGAALVLAFRDSVSARTAKNAVVHRLPPSRSL